MPTISQLPVASQVTAADQLPISQGGSACSVSVGTLLAGTQPAILAPTGMLLGRTSLGPGGPDPVNVGIGLLLNTDTLVATGADHATFSVQSVLTLSDDVVLSSGGNPKLLQLPLLRGLFSSGSNISIDQAGTISATFIGGTSGYSITSLPTVTSISSADLVAISQAGSDHTIAYGNLVDGQTINQLATAAAASDSDTLLVAQGENVMLCQTLAAIWIWLNSKLPSYQMPTAELLADTALNAEAHNGRILICSQPVTVTPSLSGMGSGFICNIINVSGGNVTFGNSIMTSSGVSTLGPSEAATITCATYSGGTIVYAWTGGASSSLNVPGPVSGFAASSESTSTVALVWTAISPPPTSYSVQYRISGTAGWWTAPSVSTSECTVTGLLPATSYDFIVFAANSAGAGTPSAIVNVSTLAGSGPPGQVIGLTAGNAAPSSMSLVWASPGSGGAVGSYTVQYRISGTSSWSTAGSGVTSTSFVATGLLPTTSYDFEIFAVNTVGIGPESNVVTASTTATSTSVVSIVWDVVPSGTYTSGSGAIAINAHIIPTGASVQFGFSTSATTPPTNWTTGNHVNTDLWGAYVSTPSVPGTWFAWCEGTDGSGRTAYVNGFLVD